MLQKFQAVDRQRAARGEYEIQAVINQMLTDGFLARGVVQLAPREWDAARDGTTEL